LYPSKYHEYILRGITNNALEPGPFAGEGQEVVKPHNHDLGEGDEGDEGDEGEQLVHMEQIEGEGDDDALHLIGTNDGGAEGFDMHVVEHYPK